MTTNSMPLTQPSAGETEHSEHLMLDPRPRREINNMVMEAMTTTPRSFWIIVGVLTVLVAVCLFGAWLYMLCAQFRKS